MRQTRFNTSSLRGGGRRRAVSEFMWRLQQTVERPAMPERMVLISLPSPTDPKFEAGTTMEKLSKAKKITIGTKFDQPLFGLKGPGRQAPGL